MDGFSLLNDSLQCFSLPRISEILAVEYDANHCINQGGREALVAETNPANVEHYRSDLCLNLAVCNAAMWIVSMSQSTFKC